MKISPVSVGTCSLCLLATVLSAQTPATLKIDTGTPVATVSPMLYGLMTEEINYSYDGGLYPELLRNRTMFAPHHGLELWPAITHGDSVEERVADPAVGPSEALPASLRLTISKASSTSQAGVANGGYWGIPMRPSTTYRGSFYAKSQGVGAARVRILTDEAGVLLAEATVDIKDGDWQQYSYELQTAAGIKTSSTNHLEITFAKPGTVWLQLVSLFPPTFNNRPNGNRPDLINMMAAMKPQFLRLPGGNYLEGDFINERFKWKETIGPLVDRPTHRSPWNYQSTDGMGLLEFLEWCEDLKVEPVLAVYAGYSLKGEHVEPGPALEPYIQEALEEIEYVAGDVSTKWGAVRAKDGHAAPFPFHYIEVGNEDFFDKSGSYDGRFDQFAKAIRAKYPKYQLIATAPVKSGNPDIIDDHYYRTPDEFFAMVHHDDTFDRKGPKIFVGEWATRTGSPTPDFGAALGDAAWMTSMERNSDLILMASYAPLLTNVSPGGMQWSTDLIGYNALQSYASPAYWAQVLFGNHLGDHTVQSNATGSNPLLFWSATLSTTDKVLHLKLVNASDVPQPLSLDIANAAGSDATLYTLHATTRFATNSIEHPDSIKPVMSKIKTSSKPWTHTILPNSIEVLDIAIR
ncbi:alpha-L-arabinofuranosidase C-terminal domain-containing protein [Granulicella arctica]|uniref:alpha-L-arabinofuranosidase C-terminal domain-containing protein n=1 Tax=Granulicella arctica TaxID=940613 RepID=UPI0021E0EE8B|nr:alpha-L-arabinofuranosidase C-terminal domain-containing protein [Granulicella arctica]